MKNNCYVFERLFKIQKNAIFLSGISFCVLEILTLLYYANWESNDIMRRAAEMVKYWIENSLWRYQESPTLNKPPCLKKTKTFPPALKPYLVIQETINSHSNPQRWWRQEERHQTKGLMRKLMAVRVRYKSLSSAKQQRKTNMFSVDWGTRTTTAYF